MICLMLRLRVKVCDLTCDTKDSPTLTRADGVLKPEITPATLCPWIDFNINSRLNKFGLRNGPPALPMNSLLNEKWESLVLVPVDDGKKDEYFLIVISDNDFITQNGKRF